MNTRIVKLGLLMIGMMGGLTACVTSFQGSPHVEGGRQGCESKCKGQGMAVAGMVYMGEYSSACVCEVPNSASAALNGGGAAAGGGAVAVEMMRRQSQQGRQAGARY